MPVSSGKLLDLLAIPAEERSFAALETGRRIAPGSALPAPQGVFPRYVEPETADDAPKAPKEPKKPKKP
jgi:methionyl-tRNA synthetase